MNYYRNINRENIQFDFLIDEDSTYIPKEEIESLGGKIILVPPYQKIFKYIKSLKKIFKENGYKIVHSNLNSLSVFPLFVAQICGVKIRIAHSHSTSNKKEWKKNIIKNILRPFSKLFATHYFACSEHAARWLFGNKVVDDGKVTIINNAIDVEKFKFNEDVRKKIRKELNIENKFVIGHVGRFVEQKNHTFIIDLFYEVHKKNKNSVLLLIGDGPLESQIKDKVRCLHLESNVKFLGIKENVNDYMQAMDLFLFPSLYEGFGIVLIEAQYSGLPCVVSTEVPLDAKISDNIIFLKLNSSKEIWIENIMSKKRNKEVALKSNKYNIFNEAKFLEKEYLELLKYKNK